MSSVARIVSGVTLFFFAALGTFATFGTFGMHNACSFVNTWDALYPGSDFTGIGTLTEAECSNIFLSAVKSAPRGKADVTAALVYTMVSVVIRIEGVCFGMIMVMGWYTLLFVKFEHRYPIHLAFAAFGACAFCVDGNISGLIPFGHDDGLLPTGALGQKLSAGLAPIFFLWMVMLPCHLFAFAASKAADAKCKSA